MEEFALCWNNFSENLATGFQNLLDRGNLLVDCTLACEGKLLRAHKIVLAICSPYFQEMFVSNPCKHPIIILKDVSYGIMSELLQFMYQGEVNVKQSELQQFMKIAETLQIKGLTTSSSSNSTSKDDKTNHSTNTSPSADHKANQGTLKRSHTAPEDSPKKPQTNKRPNIEEPEINAENIDQLASEEVFLPQITMVESRFDMSHVKRENNNDIPTSSPQSPNSIIRNNFVNSVTNQMNPGPPPNFNYEYPNELHSQNDYKAATSGYIDPIAGASITMLSSTSLLHGNCIFNRNNTVATQQGMKTYWLCKSYRITMCRARCITHQGRVISATGVHNHPAHMNVKNQEIPPTTGPLHHNNSSSQSPPHNPYVQQPPPNMPSMAPQGAQHGLHHPGQLMHYPHFPHHHMPHHQPPMMNPQMMQEMNMNAPPNLQITPIGTVNMNPSVSQANNEMLGNLNILRSMHQPPEKNETPQIKQDQSIQSVDLCSSSPTSNQSHSPQSSHNQSTDNSSTRPHGHDDILVLSPHDNSIQSSFKIEHNL